MSECHVLCFKPPLRLEWRRQDGQDETEQRKHCALTLSGSFSQSMRMKVLGTHTRRSNGARSGRRAVSAAGIKRDRHLATSRRLLTKGRPELDRHGLDDTLPKSLGRSKQGRVAANAFVLDPQHSATQIKLMKANANWPPTRRIGVLQRVDDEFGDDDANGDGAVRIDLYRIGS
jgi:hypothetical protein